MIRFVFLTLLLSTQLSQLPAQPQVCREAQALIAGLTQRHVAPHSWTPTRSQAWLDETLLRLDPEGLYWTQADLTALRTSLTTLPDLIDAPGCAWFEALYLRYQRRLQAIDGWLDSLAARPYQPALTPTDWRVGDTPQLAPTLPALQQRWAAWLQMRTLHQWFQQAPDSLRMNQAAFLTAWDSLRSTALREAHCDLRQTLAHPRGLDTYVAEVALNALANAYDPHTVYFSAEEVASFEADLATEALSFGLEIRQNDRGEIEIADLQPGGPAWRSNALNQGDILLRLLPRGQDEIDLTCANLGDIRALLTGSQTRAITLVVRKATGQIREVKLEQAPMTVEENVISGFLLEGERRLGYIYLPGFYTDLESEDMVEGLANDVAKELLKLRLARIEGLILDLRYNGGGAMTEAIGLAGLFIDEGPISILTGQEAEPDVMKDFYRGTGYDGPLVVMVNGMSASASELFAAAMQDYHRAVIVGTPTYGKATGQSIWSLAELSGDRGAKGFVKVTGGRFYRVTGQSHQQRGIVPDVALPDLWAGIMPREADAAYALSAQPVEPARRFEPGPPLPVQALIQRSQARQAQGVFPQLRAYQARMADLWAIDERLAFTFDQYARDVQALTASYRALDTLTETPVSAYEVANHPFTASLIRLDEVRRARNQDQIERISGDLYVEEAYHILRDLIELGE